GEWKQIFDEAWRINRDYFYAPNMHGIDWEQQHEKYAAFLPHVATRADLNRVLQWMSSELSVGHDKVGGGDTLTEPDVNARAGEYLLAVNGRDLRPPANVYSLFENTAGKIVEITLGPSAD